MKVKDLEVFRIFKLQGRNKYYGMLFVQEEQHGLTKINLIFFLKKRWPSYLLEGTGYLSSINTER